MGAVDGVLCSARNGQRPIARGENTWGSNYTARQPAAAGLSTSQRASQRRQEQTAQRTEYWALRKRQQRLAAANADIDLLVGSVDEADAQHLMRHADAGFMHNCPRCMAISMRADIAQGAPWASWRPSNFGGSWRMGCRICFAGRNTQAALARKSLHREIHEGKEVCQQAIAVFQQVGRIPVPSTDEASLDAHTDAETACSFRFSSSRSECHQLPQSDLAVSDRVHHCEQTL